MRTSCYTLSLLIFSIISLIALSLFLNIFSIDQPISPAIFFSWALRFGFLVSCWFLGIVVLLDSIHPSRLAVLRLSLRNFVISILSAFIISLLCGMVAVLLLRLGFYGQEWQLQSRAGYAFRLGVLTALEYSPILISSMLTVFYYNYKRKHKQVY